MTGIEIIAKERERQINEEGYINDVYYNPNGQLANAAACYAQQPEDRIYKIKQISTGQIISKPISWPWGSAYWKPSENDRIRELAKAGALIAAEIDRLLKINHE